MVNSDPAVPAVLGPCVRGGIVMRWLRSVLFALLLFVGFLAALFSGVGA